MSTVIYKGWRDHSGAHVRLLEGESRRKLPMRLDLFNHSPTGFEWGYGGSGPAQLALALLAHALEDDERAVRLHQTFKFKLIGRLSRAIDAEWEFTRERVRELADQCEAERAARTVQA